MLEYHSYLEDLNKIDIVRILHKNYPQIGKYQFSCWRARNERWCLKCEKCVRNYAILKIYGIDPSQAGIDEIKIKQNLDKYLINDIGWELATNTAVRHELETIQKEALLNKNKEIVDMISKFNRNKLLRRIYYFLTKAGLDKDHKALLIT